MALFSLALILVLLALSVEAKQLYAWGVNDYGQLGINGTVYYYPQLIPAYANIPIVDFKASGTYHMAVAANGDVYVCGNNWYGGLGFPISSGIYLASPKINPALKNCNIYIGKRHGNAVCGNRFVGWGVQGGYVAGLTTGNWGKVQDSLPIYQLGSNVANVTAGSRFSIVTLKNGTMVVAGEGAGGVLGLGDTKNRTNFVKFDAFDDIPLLQIFPSHAEHVCALSKSFSLYCWGSNTVGQLGIGNTVNQSRPTLVSFFEQQYYVVQIATGEFHTLALTAGGRVFAWGLGASGVLGNGASDNTTFSTPIEIEFLADKNVVEIVAGLNFNFVRTASNQWYSWGAGTGGVLGNLKDLDVATPTLVPFLSTFNITKILTASTSRSIYGWLDPSAPTVIVGSPPLVNECLISGDVSCKANAHCVDTDRSAICACDDGYSGDVDNCKDINECLITGICASGAACTNTPGSYMCTCPANRPIGDGKTHGTGCSPAPTQPPTQPPTQAPTPPPSSNSSTNGGSPSTGQSTSATSSTANNTAQSTSGQATASPNGGNSTAQSSGTTGVDSTGSGTNPSSTTDTIPTTSTTAASTNGRTNLYQTLFGAADEINKPVQGTSTSSDPMVISGGGKNKDKNVMIGVLIAFAVLMAIVLAVGVFLIFRARRPAPA